MTGARQMALDGLIDSGDSIAMWAAEEWDDAGGGVGGLGRQSRMMVSIANMDEEAANTALGKASPVRSRWSDRCLWLAMGGDWRVAVHATRIEHNPRSLSPWSFVLHSPVIRSDAGVLCIPTRE